MSDKTRLIVFGIDDVNAFRNGLSATFSTDWSFTVSEPRRDRARLLIVRTPAPFDPLPATRSAALLDGGGLRIVRDRRLTTIASTFESNPPPPALAAAPAQRPARVGVAVLGDGGVAAHSTFGSCLRCFDVRDTNAPCEFTPSHERGDADSTALASLVVRYCPNSGDVRIWSFNIEWSWEATVALDFITERPSDIHVVATNWFFARDQHPPEEFEDDDGLEDAIERATARGITMLTAAGNAGQSPPGDQIKPPGLSKNVLAIGGWTQSIAEAIEPDASDWVHVQSSRGPDPRKAKPDCLGYWGPQPVAEKGDPNGTVWAKGTSIAVGEVAGVVASLYRDGRVHNLDDVRSFLETGCQRVLEAENGTHAQPNAQGFGALKPFQ